MGADDQILSTTLARLQDPDGTKIIIVTLPETPVWKPQPSATTFRAGITRGPGYQPSLNGLDLESPLLRARAAAEVEHLQHVATNLATRTALVPMLNHEPCGLDALAAMTQPLPVLA